MNPNISIPPTAADAYRAMLAEQTYASLEEVTKVLSEGKYIISVENLKKSFKALSTAQNGLDVAIKDYNSIEGPGGHGSGHYQAAMNIEYYRKKIKEHISAMIEIQDGLMEQGEMTKLLQRAFIDELEDNVESLQKQIESRDDNNYVLKTQLRERKAVLAKAKADLKTLKESYCDDEQTYASLDEDHLDEAPVLTEGNMTLSLSNTDKANKFTVWCKLQYEKYGTTISDTVSVVFKSRQAAEKFAKMAGSHVLTQTTTEEAAEIVELAKKQSQGKTFSTITVMYPIDGHKTKFDVHRVSGNRGKIEYIVQNPSSIGGASPKNVFDSAEEAADAIEKAGGKRPKIVKA